MNYKNAYIEYLPDYFSVCTNCLLTRLLEVPQIIQHLIETLVMKLLKHMSRHMFVKYSQTTTNITERNNPQNLQYEHFLKLRENFTCALHDFTCMLLSVTVGTRN